MSTGAFNIGPRHAPSAVANDAIDADGGPLDGATTYVDDAVMPQPIAPPDEAVFTAAEAPQRSLLWEIVPLSLIGLLAVGWTALLTFAALREAAGPNGLLRLVTMVGVGSAPIALLAVLWLIVAHTGRGENRRYGRAARAMRLDSQNLVSVMAILTRRLEEGRELLAMQSAQLDALGEQTVGRFAATGDAIRRETADIGRLADLLQHSSGVARDDIQALIKSLPQADEQSRRIAIELRTAGMTAQDQVEALERQLSAIAESAHMADMQVKVSAERLAAQLGHITQSSTQTVRQIEDARVGIDRMVGSSMESASAAIDATRRSIAEQSTALTALADQARAAIEQTGSDQTNALARRLDEVTTRMDGLVARIAGQDAASSTLVNNLEDALDRLEQRFATLGSSGAEQTAELAEALAALATHSEHVARALGGGTVAAGTLFDRVTAVRRVLDSNARDLEDTIPAALSRLRLHAERSMAAVTSSGPQAEALARLAEETAAKLGSVAGAIEEQNRAVDSLGAGVDAKLASVREQATALNHLIAETGENAEALATSTAGRLVDAMIRVRETAAHASEQAKTALANMVPAVAGELGTAMERTVDRVLAERMRAHIAGMAAAADEAVDAAEKSAARLAAQLTEINEATQTIEAQVNEAKESAEKSDQQSFSRQVALLVESLNSAAIDVAKILATDISDTAWAAYLRGDRGVFTRRAVRLLDSNEMRDVLRHYAAAPDFREQVNRYIHDFEAMLRRVLSARDGGPLSVTILSSDMGKLYVALAQAIERLRV